MRLNQPASVAVPRTHNGGPAYPHLKPMQKLRRSLLSCMLWEKQFYEDGVEIGHQILESAHHVDLHDLAALAIEARTQGNLRHAPLLLLCVLANRAKELPERERVLVANTIASTIQRADELGEFLSLYATMNGATNGTLKRALSGQVKKGLAQAFGKFDAYQLAKYNRDDEIKLRDVLFLCHAAPNGDEQAQVWKKLIDGTLESPDTWEVQLSGGADKKETFERLIREGKLGYLALLRNLRNMMAAGCDKALVEQAIIERKGAHRVLPFRYVAAAQAAPQLEPAIDNAFMKAIDELPAFDGRTIVLVDVSGSMDCALSERSDMTRMHAAAALASMIQGDLRVFTFSYNLVEVAPRRGMAGVDAVIRSQQHGGTLLGQAVAQMNALPHYRLIVITDEQSSDRVPPPVCEKAYLINVASNRNGVGYGKWTHIDGFSESVLKFIHGCEDTVLIED